MGVDSYLEIFMTMYGWTFASIITRALADTGLLILPFLFLLVQAMLDAHQHGAEGGGVTWLIRRLEVILGTALFVFVTCVQTTPLTSLSKLGLHYAPPASAIDPAPTMATGADPQSTYGTAFADAADAANVPAWWFTVMTISTGISASVRAGISTGTRDFRQIEELAHIASIEDVRLRSEIQRFYSECYVPARSRYLRAESVSPETNAALSTYGKADVDWIGSHAFRSDPSLYGNLFAKAEVPGFAYDPSRDTDVDPSFGAVNGRPSCKEWWETTNSGLRARMVDQVGRAGQLRTKLVSVFTRASSDDVDDTLARLAVSKAPPGYIDPEHVVGDERGFKDKAFGLPSSLAGAAGTAWKGFEASATMNPLINFVTMVQPLILMGLYMFLPIITVFSGYSMQVFVLGGLAIFTVKFWSVMWFIARWTDDHLIEAMYPGSDGNVLLEALTTWDASEKRIVLNVLLMGMYIGLPLLWTSMMAWAGFNLSGGLARMMTDAIDVAKNAGKTGAEMGKKVVTKGR
ncbi:MAG: conjugal transfer protein TraG N-terminal domain-containing protein [Burkholderiales bacterium]|nr:conjugal transfer protein TraG N-terminal domain-containing protein [Burkholderiales bacterium]